MPRSDGGISRAGALTPARKIVAVADVLAALGLLFMMGIAFFDVVGRSLFSAPMPGATELMELAVAATVCCAFPSLALRGLHATIDVLDMFVPARLRPYQLGAVNILCAVAFAFVSWRVWIEGDKTARFGGQTPLLEVPMAPVLYGISVLFAISAVAFILAILTASTVDDQ